MCPAGLDNNLLILDKTGFVEALAVCATKGACAWAEPLLTNYCGEAENR